MRNKYLGILLTIVILAGITLWDYQKQIPVDTNLLSVNFLDIGQGDSIYIRAPNGNDMLIDGGPDDSVLRQLRTVMPSFDHELDLVVETHPDKDHIAGLSYVFDTYEVKNFLASEISSGTTFDKALHERVASEPNLNKITARRGIRFILDPEHGVFLDILFPDRDTTNFKATNDASIVSRLVYGDIQFLFTGDAPIKTEQFLIPLDKQILPSQVLQLAHHGSKNSTSQPWIEIVRPIYVVASAGKNNSYGHPNQGVIQRAIQFGATPLVTAEIGTIGFSSDGTSVWKR